MSKNLDIFYSLPQNTTGKITCDNGDTNNETIVYLFSRGKIKLNQNCHLGTIFGDIYSINKPNKIHRLQTWKPQIPLGDISQDRPGGIEFENIKIPTPVNTKDYEVPSYEYIVSHRHALIIGLGFLAVIGVQGTCIYLKNILSRRQKAV